MSHNKQHAIEMEKWFSKIKISKESKLEERFKTILALYERINEEFEVMKQEINDLEKKTMEKEKKKKRTLISTPKKMSKSFKFIQIGTIHTPYIDNAPRQPIANDEGDFYIELFPKYTDGLHKLDTFKYIYVIYYIDRITKRPKNIMNPSWAGNVDVGIFASRSPVRPNLIGLSIVKIKKIKGNLIHTTGLDVFDNTPLLDIKPYIKDLDSKSDANYGWIEDLEGYEHLLLHIKGIPHDY
ncbi:MAG: tRNA (N6-threonylcarbamoyladenosine(37)-N6)-methyltransferase TrmO [Promethearchaeota archaeon]